MNEAPIHTADRNKERIRLLDQQERESHGLLRSLRSRMRRKIDALMGNEQKYRFHAWDLNDLQPFCSDEEMQSLREDHEQRQQKEASPEWAVVATYGITAAGQIEALYTKVATAENPLIKRARARGAT